MPRKMEPRNALNGILAGRLVPCRASTARDAVRGISCLTVAQTKEGAKKSAARRRGLTLEEFQAKLDEGLKWCTGCKAWHPRSAFQVDNSRGDSLACVCKAWRRTHYRRVYKPRPRPKPGRRYIDARDGDKKQARSRVNHLVAVGVLPDPNTLPCTDCGQIRHDDRRHEYDHYMGYAAEHHETVEPVCSSCHHARHPVVRQRGPDGRFTA